jgi:hypothetical protein
LAEDAEGSAWREPVEHVLFGDVFVAPWLLDLFVRDDTALIGGGELPENLVPKLGKWMGTQLPPEAIGLYSPVFPPKDADRYALAHASFLPDVDAHHAILVSDSCLTATSLVQGRAKRSVSGRLLFAPVRGVPEADWHKLQQEADYGRFPLPASQVLPAFAVAELRQCFMVDAVHVKAHVQLRVLACGGELAEDLEAQWNAYAARRGPVAYERNALKLAFLLAGGELPTEDDEAVTDTIAEVLDCAWALEGGNLEDTAEAEEAVRLGGERAEDRTPELLDGLITRLRQLSALAGRAADTLDSRRSSS